MATITEILNPDTKGVTKEEMVKELRREYALRMKVYPKWLGAKLTREQACKQMKALKASILLIESLIKQEQGEQKELF